MGLLSPTVNRLNPGFFPRLLSTVCRLPSLPLGHPSVVPARGFEPPNTATSKQRVYQLHHAGENLVPGAGVEPAKSLRSERSAFTSLTTPAFWWKREESNLRCLPPRGSRVTACRRRH